MRISYWSSDVCSSDLLFDTKTTQLFIAVGNNRQFATLCDALVDKALGQDARYKTNKDRVVNRESLTARLNSLLSNFDGLELFTKLMGLGVPCGPVLTTEQALSLDHTSHRKMTVTLGEYHGVGIPVDRKSTRLNYSH